MLERLKEYIVKNRFKLALYIITVAVSAVLLAVGHKAVYNKENMFLGGYDDGAAKATVTEIVSVDIDKQYVDMNYIGEDIHVVFKCEITSGELKGQTVEAVESITAFDSVKLEAVEVGDKILIIEAEDEQCDWYLYDYDRSMPLWILGIAFIALILLFPYRITE